MRILVLTMAILTVLAALPSTAQQSVALSEQQIQARGRGQVLGSFNGVADAYGIDLALTDGVRPRDVYEVRRKDKRIAEVIVVFAGPTYSMIMPRGSNAIKLQRGDRVSYARTLAMPRTAAPQLLPSEPIILRERECKASGSVSFGTFGMPTMSTPTLSFPTINVPSLSLPSLSFPTFSAPTTISGAASFGMPSFSTPDVRIAAPSMPSFSAPPSSFSTR